MEYTTVGSCASFMERKEVWEDQFDMVVDNNANVRARSDKIEASFAAIRELLKKLNAPEEAIDEILALMFDTRDEICYLRLDIINAVAEQVAKEENLVIAAVKAAGLISNALDLVHENDRER